ISTERKRSVSMQRWSREAGSWVDDMGVLRIDVDAHANRSLAALARSEEHTSELQSLMRISYAVFCLKKKNKQHNPTINLESIISGYILNKRDRNSQTES